MSKGLEVWLREIATQNESAGKVIAGSRHARHSLS